MVIPWFGLAGVVLIGALVLLSWIDIKTGFLPDALTLPLLWLGLLVNLGGLITPLPEAVLGAVFGYLSLWTINFIYRSLNGEDGMGYGDFKLTAALGAWLGWMMLPWIVFGASAVGYCGAMIHRSRRGVIEPLPFGPYLSVAGVVALGFVFSR